MEFKVFVSWSQSRSYVVALALKGFLRDMLHAVRPVMSDDMEGGGSKIQSLNAMLREADFVVLCMTAENWHEPWIFYEAGMVYGKSDEMAKVCPYVIDRRRSLLPEPINQFTAVMADKDGTLNLVKTLNKASGSLRSEVELKEAFEARWPELEKVINEVRQTSDKADSRLCVRDFDVVKECIRDHQNKAESRLRECIDWAQELVRADSFDREVVVDFAWSQILISKERFRTTKSILVGNVADFFDANYSKGELRDLIVAMEPDLRSHDPLVAAAKLLFRMQSEAEEIFRRYHLILLGRLRECLEKG